MDASISAASLKQSVLGAEPPLVIDVRRNPRFLEAGDLIRGALRRDHGHEVSQNVAKALGARYLEGGIEAWREGGGELFKKPRNSSSRWVTLERPKIDRNFANDHEMLEHGMVMYDALYAWCKEGKNEIHTWDPALYK
jgi:hypothetical protein